jgi:hypothetical protein
VQRKGVEKQDVSEGPLPACRCRRIRNEIANGLAANRDLLASHVLNITYILQNLVL